MLNKVKAVQTKHSAVVQLLLFSTASFYRRPSLVRHELRLDQPGVYQEDFCSYTRPQVATGGVGRQTGQGDGGTDHSLYHGVTDHIKSQWRLHSQIREDEGGAEHSLHSCCYRSPQTQLEMYVATLQICCYRSPQISAGDVRSHVTDLSLQITSDLRWRCA